MINASYLSDNLFFSFFAVINKSSDNSQWYNSFVSSDFVSLTVNKYADINPSGHTSGIFSPLSLIWAID